MYLPSGENATELIQAVCLRRTSWFVGQSTHLPTATCATFGNCGANDVASIDLHGENGSADK